MVIYINGRFLTQSLTGVQRFATELLKELDKQLSNTSHFSVKVLAPKNIKWCPEYQNIEVRKVGHLRGHLWEQVELPFFSRSGLLINLCNTGPICKLNQVVTIHDVSVFVVPFAYSLSFRLFYKLLFFTLGKTSRRIFTVSNFSKKDIIKYCRVKPDKIDVLKEGKEHVYDVVDDDSIIDTYDLMDTPYILAVSSLNPNKNFKLIVDAVDVLGSSDYKVVIAGGTNPRVFGSSERSFPANVVYVGYVSDSQLCALYRHASVFVYPSFYEGFGLPPLEAMACGCPVIVSQATSMAEVCGEAALYCDPNSFQDLSEKIEYLMNSEGLAKKMKAAGLKRVGQYEWRMGAKSVLDIVSGMVGENC